MNNEYVDSPIGRHRGSKKAAEAKSQHTFKDNEKSRRYCVNAFVSSRRLHIYTYSGVPLISTLRSRDQAVSVSLLVCSKSDADPIVLVPIDHDARLLLIVYSSHSGFCDVSVQALKMNNI